MDWINIKTSQLRSPEYIGSEPPARATWLSLLGYCTDQENGGRIVGAATWKDRQWQQAAGVTLQEVQEAAPLVVIDGADVVVWEYPVDKEAEVKNARENGKKGGRPRKKKNPDGTQTKPRKNHMDNHPVNPEKTTRQNVKERKGKEEEEEGEFPAPGSGYTVSSEEREATQRKEAPFTASEMPQEAPTTDITDEDRWYASTCNQPWAKTLRRAGAKIGPRNWIVWKGLLSELFMGDHDEMAKFIGKINARDRWPDQVESEYKSRNSTRYDEGSVIL